MKRWAVGLAALVVLGTALPSLAKVTYTVTWLGDLPGGNFSSRANALNDLGQVVGRSHTGQQGGYRAFLWQNGSMIDIGDFGDQTIAYDINNHGQVIGYSSGEQAHRPFLWDSESGMVDFGSFPIPPSFPPGYSWNGFHFPYGINESGQITGRAGGIHSATFEYVYAFLYDTDGTWTDLGGLPYTKGSVAYAQGINDNTQIVGYSTTDVGGEVVRRAFLWEDGEMTDLGTLPGGNGYSSARGINIAGQVVGDSDGSGLGGRATLWDHGAISELPNLPGDNRASAFAINAEGTVVGRSIFADTVDDMWVFEQSACIWLNGEVYDLNALTDLAPGVEMLWASDINNVGQICGHGIGPNGFEEAFLLTPIPEPSTLALLSMGVLAIGVGWWRRRRAT